MAVVSPGLAGPMLITGSDPTMIPIAGIVAPIVAMAATAYASVGVVAVAARDETVGDRVDTLIRQVARAVPETG